jgi:hypothetical protein
MSLPELSYFRRLQGAHKVKSSCTMQNYCWPRPKTHCENVDMSRWHDRFIAIRLTKCERAVPIPKVHKNAATWCIAAVMCQHDVALCFYVLRCVMESTTAPFCICLTSWRFYIRLCPTGGIHARLRNTWLTFGFIALSRKSGVCFFVALLNPAEPRMLTCVLMHGISNHPW